MKTSNPHKKITVKMYRPGSATGYSEEKILRPANCLAPLFTSDIMDRFARIDAHQATQSNPMR